MRLFIAIKLNQEMKDALLDIQDGMREAGVRGRYSPEENLHLTLAFIGEFSDGELVREVLDGIAFAPFPLALDGVGSFGRLWWAGVERSDELAALAKRIRRGLADAGIPFDRKKFSAHITLIRGADVRPEDIPADDVARARGAGMTVERVALMRSDRGKRGMVYREVR